MSTSEYAIPDIEIGAPATEPPSDPVELDRYIGWRLRRIAQERQQMARNTAIAKAEIERYTTWLDEVNAGHQRSIEWLEDQVRMAALTYDFRGKKSRKLAEGTFGFRAAGGRTTITDMDAALAFAREKGVPVRVVESVGIADIKTYIESTGETLPFVEVEPKEDRFYVKVEVEE